VELDVLFIGAHMDAIDVGGRMGFAAGHSITYDDSSYTSTTAVMRSARELVRRTRRDEDAAFSEADRQTAMGAARVDSAIGAATPVSDR
jgi:hypothetical protein